MAGFYTVLAALLALWVGGHGVEASDALKKIVVKFPEVKPTTELISKFGYPAEGHHVQTDDGYVLRMDRIPRPGAEVVFMGNPLTCNSACYCMLERQSLAFKLFDAGYDVWLGNFRGNGLSKNHTRYTVNDHEFWDYSFHENGVLDVPAMVDYIVSATGRQSMLYAGHSMGSTALLVTASLRPRTARRIRAAFLMGPAAFVAHHDTPSLYVTHALLNQTRAFEERFGAHKAPGLDFLSRAFGAVLCRTFVPKNEANDCAAFQLLVDFVAGSGRVVYPADFHHYLPSGASVKQIVHYAQLADRAWPGFRQYDNGVRRNRQVYGQDAPPDYNLAANTIPIYVYTGNTDRFVMPEDIRLLAAALSNVRKVYEVPVKNFGHLDFLLNPDAPTQLYDEILADMAKHQIAS